MYFKDFLNWWRLISGRVSRCGHCRLGPNWYSPSRTCVSTWQWGFGKSETPFQSHGTLDVLWGWHLQFPCPVCGRHSWEQAGFIALSRVMVENKMPQQMFTLCWIISFCIQGQLLKVCINIYFQFLILMHFVFDEFTVIFSW